MWLLIPLPHRMRRGEKPEDEEKLVGNPLHRPQIHTQTHTSLTLHKHRYTHIFVFPSQMESLGHYTTFALEGRSGELRWQHMPADFQVHPAFPPVSSPFWLLDLTLPIITYLTPPPPPPPPTHTHTLTPV